MASSCSASFTSTVAIFVVSSKEIAERKGKTRWRAHAEPTARPPVSQCTPHLIRRAQRSAVDLAAVLFLGRTQKTRNFLGAAGGQRAFLPACQLWKLALRNIAMIVVLYLFLGAVAIYSLIQSVRFRLARLEHRRNRPDLWRLAGAETEHDVEEAMLTDEGRKLYSSHRIYDAVGILALITLFLAWASRSGVLDIILDAIN